MIDELKVAADLRPADTFGEFCHTLALHAVFLGAKVDGHADASNEEEETCGPGKGL